ncbi:condensation domain-containing protein [Streptomyces sp. NPDC002537]
MEIAPGRVFEWKMVSTKMRGSVIPPQSHETTTYNQVKHFTAAQDARSANDPISTYVAGTFEIHGPVDLQALESALLHFVRRHEALRCTFQQLAGDLTCAILEPDDVALKLVDVGNTDTAEEIGSYIHRFFQGIDTLSWPLIGMGAVVRDESTTVYFACDHLVTDGMSTPIAVHDIATAYEEFSHGRQPAFPEAGSYLGFSHEQRRRNRSMAADDGRLEYWKGFVERNGDFFPAFPLDLGVEPGCMYPTINEAGLLLAAADVEALETRCQAVGGRLFMGILAAVGVALKKEGGPDVYRAFMPVSERGRGSYAHSMGWFINTMPIEFSVHHEDFTEIMGNVRAASTEMRRHIDVPFVQVWRLLAPEYFAMRNWPFAVNFFSYLDFRKAPGSENHAAWKARKHIWASQSNGICFWFHRNDDGLYVNSLFVDTPQAHRTQAALRRTLVRTLENMAHSGTF